MRCGTCLPDRGEEYAEDWMISDALWLECPLMPEEIDAHEELAGLIRTPIAVGESYRTSIRGPARSQKRGIARLYSARSRAVRASQNRGESRHGRDSRPESFRMSASPFRRSSRLRFTLPQQPPTAGYPSSILACSRRRALTSMPLKTSVRGIGSSRRAGIGIESDPLTLQSGNL